MIAIDERYEMQVRVNQFGIDNGGDFTGIA